MELNARQRLFVSYYLGVSSGNATDAARRAGCPHPEVAGHRLLRNVNVRAAIDAKLDQVALTSDQILARLSEVATGGVSDFIEVTEGGFPRLDFASAKKRGKMKLLRKFKQTETGVEIETHDPIKALDMLGKYRRLWSDKPDGDGNTIKVSVEYIDTGPVAPAARESEEDP